MDNISEQRACIKFCFKIGKNATETFELIKLAFGDITLSRCVTFDWFKRFKEGRISIEDDHCPGRPSTSKTIDTINLVRDKIRYDRRSTVGELANEVGISIGTCHSILSDELGMKRVSAKSMPKLLTKEQMEHRVEVCLDLKNRVSNDSSFIKSIITGDETWVYGYDPETKFQSSQWKTSNSPRPKKCRQVRSNIKAILIVFFYFYDLVRYEFVHTDQTVNQVFYKQVLERLKEKVPRKRPEAWKSKSWFLHHDNEPAHFALSVSEFLTSKNIPVVPHPPYSLDLALCDFFLFPRLKSTLKGHRFEDVNETIHNATQELKAITIEEIQRCFKKWQDRWEHCIEAEGHYFEGDPFK
ncbi:protein GVQW3-like [Sipha flava]|uniref:Protein GVQW3-like n=1 Tax=Sipha flava TaxID=143950 RepID=A0A8B8F5B4_9HEMI|nr:protein GVQW3-like [Sipha flava]